MVDSLFYLLLIKLVGSSLGCLRPDLLISGEFEFPLSDDFGWLPEYLSVFNIGGLLSLVYLLARSSFFS